MLIYIIKNNTNGKSYIGKTKLKLEKRLYHHRYQAFTKNKNTILYKAFRKYGYENFTIEILIDNVATMEELNKLEIDYIKTYRTDVEGYNMTKGGDSGPIMIGDKHPAFGKPNLKLTELNKTRKGIKLKPQHKAKVIKGLQGHVVTKDTKIKMSESRKKAWDNGVYSSPEYKEIMRIKSTGRISTSRRKIMIIETGETFDSLKEAIKLGKGTVSGISTACSGKQKTHRNLHWKYLN